MIHPYAWVALSCGLFLLTGYLLGVRLGAAARDELRAALDRARADADRLASRELPGEGDGLREVQRILSPLLERERVAQSIQHIALGRGTRDELPRLLDAIAAAGGWSAVVLSDDSGLHLAASADAERVEVLAGVWSQLLSLADSVVENGEPAPVSARVSDLDGRVLVHRIFSAGNQRFLLTAVSRGASLGPEALEPAVAKIERVLLRDAWQS